MNNNKKAVVLLSGGLDSVVSLASVINDGVNVKLALTFDYGQKAGAKEIEASKNIADFYGVEHKVIKLDWLKEITNTSLVADKDIPEFTEPDLIDAVTVAGSMMKVWVPNRNALFINIAASFCDSLLYEYIVIGANREEGQTFPDNSLKFVEKINHSISYSTTYDIEVVAPLIKLDKEDIVKAAVKLNVPLHLINSCYKSDIGHCGVCESCCRLKRALSKAKMYGTIDELFNRR